MPIYSPSSTLQDFIDNTLYQIQCCIGTLAGQIADQALIGFECPDKKEELLELYAIQLALLHYDPSVLDEDSCLTSSEINILIAKAKTICGNCCIQPVEEQ